MTAVRLAVAGRVPPDGKIPLNVAFRRAVSTVESTLKAEGVVWGDEAKAAVVTCLIETAAANGWLAPWERDAA